MNRNYTQRTLFYLILLCSIFFNNSLYATHIVGGEINYRCLGNNQYEITLRVFRDCDTGDPWFDNPASVGVFDANNILIYDLRLLMRENDTLDLNLSDPCLVAPPNVCIHTTSYVDTVTLPFRPGGYQLVYQRCCRNVDIVNIVNPLGAGATYYCLITEEALQTCNSSAVFNSWPPVYICANRPILFNHSAIDVDGDSLVYEMCIPLDGASFFNPIPQPPNNPPYIPINWLPGFGVNNMLGGTDSLRINPQTGILQGTPTILGVFVVGICVSEYRNGQLISTSRRDFQYAIGICGQLVSSAFFAPEIQCDNSLMVQFQNNSNSLGTGYVWNFGDSTTNATSTLENPVYIYPDTGIYTITLIADPGTLCADTSIQMVNLQYQSIIMDFDVAVTDCSDTVRLQVVDLTIDTISTIVDWNWTFGNGLTSNIPFATTYYTQSGTYPISLTVQAANGCTATLSDTITLNIPDISSPDSVAICSGVSNIVLNPGGDPTHSYQWSPATGLSSTTAASPIANPAASTTYNVTVTAFNGVDSCVLYRSVTVLIAPPISLQAMPDVNTCNDTIFLTANTTGVSNFSWSFNSNFSPIFSNQNPARVLMPVYPSSANVYVRASDAYGCSVFDTIKVNRFNVPIVADFSYSYQGCSDQLSVQFTDQTVDFSQGPIIGWFWDFGNGTSSSQQNPVSVYNNGNAYIVNLSVLSAQGCVGFATDTIPLFQLPQLNGSDSAGICQGQSSVQLNIGGNLAYTYQWAPATGLNNTTIASPIANPSVPTVYTVTITSTNANFSCLNVDTVFVGFPPPITVSVPDQSYCGTQVTLTATSSTAVSYQWAGNPSFFTILATGNPVTITPTTFPAAGYYVRATDAYGCTASDFALVQQVNTPVNVTFTTAPQPCDDTLRVRFNNTTAVSGATISNISWVVSGNQYYQTSAQNNPVFSFTQGGTYIVDLFITLSNGCTGVSTQVFDFNVANITTPPNVALCGGASSITLNPNGDDINVSYQWSPAIGLNNPLTASPIATPPSLPFTYTVTITANNSFGSCQTVRTVNIISAPPIAMALVPDTTFCNPQLLVYAMPTAGVVRWEWSTDPTFSSYFLINVNPISIGFGNSPFTYTLYTRAYDQYGCTVVDTGVYNFITTPVPVNATATPLGCDDDSLVVQFNDLTIPTGGTINSWFWNFGNGNSSNAQNPSFAYNAANAPYTYSLLLSLTNGCTGIFSDSIDYLIPNFVSNDSLGLCGNLSPVVLNQGGNPNLVYQWSPATGLSSTTAPSPLLTPSGNVTYTVTITAPNNGDTCRAVHDFSVFADSFDFHALPDTLICDNRVNLYVNTSPTTEVQWALDPNFNLIVGAGNPFFTYLNSTRMFYVRGRNAFGCEGVDSVLVRVHTAPINVSFDMTTVACGDSLTINFRDLTTDTLYNAITAWTWNFGNGAGASVQNPTYTYTQDGNYQVTLSIQTENGCSGQTMLPLSLQFPSLQIPNDTVISCIGSSVALNLGADPTLLYQWSPAAGLDNPQSPNPIATPSSQQTYSVTVTAISQIGNLTDSCQLTGAVTVLVPFPNFVPNDSLGLCGNLSAVVLNPGADTTLSYQWSPVTGLSSGTAPSPLLTPSANIIYTVTITAAHNGDICTAIQNFTVFADSFDIAALSDTLTCDSSINLYVNNPSAIQVEWALDPNFNLIVGFGNPYFTYLNSTRMFYVRGRNAFGCEGVDSVLVRVHTAPINVSFDMTTVACGDSLTINFRDLTTDTLFNAISAWTWNFGNGAGASVQNPTYTYTQDGNYQVTLSVQTVNGCSGQTTLPLSLQFPSLQIPNDIVISCGGLAVALNPGADPTLLYQWSPAAGLDNPQSPNPIANPSSQQTYSVTVTAISQIGNLTDSCQLTGAVTVLVPPAISVTVDADNLVCSSDVSLSAQSNFGTQYEWALDSNFTNIISSQAAFSTTQNNATETYYVRSTDAFGCSAIDYVSILQRSILATINSVAVSCPNEPAQLTVTNLNGGDVLSYSWTPDSLLLSGQGTSQISTAPDSNTLFTVFLTNQYGCADTLQAMVTVAGSFPALNIEAEPDTIFIGASSQLTATQNNGYTYIWQSNTSLSATNIYNPTASPTETNIYFLTVSDVNGCKNRDSIIIYTKTFVCEEPYIFVPNTFTPDADGLNDLLFVRGNVITELYFAVYNRWGEKIFETTSQDIGWDGTFKGQALSPDVYGYYLRYKCIGQSASDKAQFKKGNVTLIR